MNFITWEVFSGSPGIKLIQREKCRVCLQKTMRLCQKFVEMSKRMQSNSSELPASKYTEVAC